MNKTEKMNWGKIFLAVILLTGFVLLFGCGTISENLKDKSVSSGFEVYGLKATAFDPSTGSLSPTGWVGWANGYYHSCPVQKGQAFKVTRRSKSWWTGDFSSEVIIDIKAAPSDGQLEVQGGAVIGIPLKTKAKFTATPGLIEK